MQYLLCSHGYDSFVCGQFCPLKLHVDTMCQLKLYIKLIIIFFNNRTGTEREATDRSKLLDEVRILMEAEKEIIITTNPDQDLVETDGQLDEATDEISSKKIKERKAADKEREDLLENSRKYFLIFLGI